MPFIQQLRGRAQFLRDRGEVKSPVLLELAAAKLVAVEGLRPHWAHGHASDSIAAQTQSAALSQIWRFLGVDDQTSAMSAMRRLVNQPVLGVPTGKYADVLTPFVALMERELHANAGKGDRPGWLQMDRKTVLLEIYYHLSKLQKAMKDDNPDGICEHAADVANMSMMAVDVCGLLIPHKESNQ
ncbi:hypothetical protein PLUTO_00690 [Luteibacter phage vB_LflM-Pluto]|uniref:Uncharacterized protein n=1 Tax=Luteibacter phage vB_LflM-Pluto TaxID=2948611 RepID=A0A9E7MUP3_9CAUD|nr:hypothetical protein PLUTO_00690 [Luteibacter phage vB_LflM-Pluto]